MLARYGVNSRLFTMGAMVSGTPMVLPLAVRGFALCSMFWSVGIGGVFRILLQ